ncbi:MAG: hypothetical protein N3A56_00245 [Thermodesulfobacteriaceae bacterium]|nr:hypothetical protein [Thermodesulfobacteriaceae bacterium]
MNINILFGELLRLTNIEGSDLPFNQEKNSLWKFLHDSQFLSVLLNALNLNQNLEEPSVKDLDLDNLDLEDLNLDNLDLEKLSEISVLYGYSWFSEVLNKLSENDGNMPHSINQEKKIEKIWSWFERNGLINNIKQEETSKDIELRDLNKDVYELVEVKTKEKENGFIEVKERMFNQVENSFNEEGQISRSIENKIDNKIKPIEKIENFKAFLYENEKNFGLEDFELEDLNIKLVKIVDRKEALIESNKPMWKNLDKEEIKGVNLKEIQSEIREISKKFDIENEIMNHKEDKGNQRFDLETYLGEEVQSIGKEYKESEKDDIKMGKDFDRGFKVEVKEVEWDRVEFLKLGEGIKETEVKEVSNLKVRGLIEMLKNEVLKTKERVEGKGVIEIRDEVLGNMEIEVEVDNREVRIISKVDKPEIVQEFRSYSLEIKQSLEEVGLKLKDFQIFLGTSFDNISSERHFNSYRRGKEKMNRGIDNLDPREYEEISEGRENLKGNFYFIV